MTHLTRTRLLEGAGLFIAVTGLVAVLSVLWPTNPLITLFFSGAAYPLQGDPLTTRVDLLMLAIIGGLTCGIGVFLFAVARHIYARDPQTGGRIATMGFVAWFVPDSIGSVLAGAASNVGLNLVFLVVALGAIWWPGREEARA